MAYTNDKPTYQRSQIVVDVNVDEDGSPEKVVLSGYAVAAMEGELNI